MALIFSACATDYPQPGEQRINSDWKFALHDQPGAEAPGFDDSGWRMVDLPHDYSIEQPFDSAYATGPDGGYTFAGVGWYRKSFTLPDSTADQRVAIRFGGIYRNSDVWLNGHHLGSRPYGYVTIHYDLTPFLHPPGQKNILAVRADTRDQPNSRWYTGAGIYRNVDLLFSSPVHFPPGGVFIRTETLTRESALLRATAEIANGSTESRSLTLELTLRDRQGRIVAESSQNVNSGIGDTVMVEQVLEVAEPQMWSIEDPHLYRFEARLMDDGRLMDRYETDTGIRTFRFDPSEGFFLNGEHVKLKGTNNHHDCGPLGAACLESALERQLRILKEMGSNALRLSHNPMSVELLQLADRMGFVVISEIFDEWLEPKRPYGYAPHFMEWRERDIADWMRRDRNHPSVIAWSLGNEVGEQQTGESGADILRDLIDIASLHDTTRPFTVGMDHVDTAQESGFVQLLDLAGYNYGEPQYREHHEQFPDRVIYGSETLIHPLYDYDSWLTTYTEDFVAGEFLWTGFDYLGEAGIGGTAPFTPEPWNHWPKWPWRSAVSGVVDLAGFTKPGYWFRKALWSDEPVLHLAVQVDEDIPAWGAKHDWGWPDVLEHWNYSEPGREITVHAYTNLPEVELLVNGRPHGSQHWRLEERPYLTWRVPFEPGYVEAVGRLEDGSEQRFRLETAGEPAAIRLTPDRESIQKGKQDLAYVKAEIIDEEGRRVPFATVRITFSVQGEGSLRAVGNGDPTSHTPFTGSVMEAFQGRALAIILSGDRQGEITVTATSPGLEAASLTIAAE
ncbi:glycoside hydrolase family 2 TIM barrel-domain containing protein [Balneolales bacterium ANBcel1]|nr:glycoside hydrolase family 2 TIM barrel-domain containing protein [Balneolales bacterium ANBcel1]